MKKDETVFLFDVDNTLLDNDRVTSDLKTFLTSEVGAERCDHYWQIFEHLRAELGYADYLGSLQRYRVAYPYDSHLLAISEFLIDYPFRERLFPQALDVIAHCRKLGKVVILTDGDVVFQPRKIHSSGLFKAVDGNILVYIHKEMELHDVERRYPASQYVLVDDKIRILTAIKDIWNDRVITVFPRQGHYAHDTASVSKYPPADHSIEGVGDMLTLDVFRQSD